jgi:hypothetical protein
MTGSTVVIEILSQNLLLRVISMKNGTRKGLHRIRISSALRDPKSDLAILPREPHLGLERNLNLLFETLYILK